MEDEDARAIRLRRARFIAGALVCVVGCGEEGTAGPSDPTSAVKPATATAVPTPCLSFGCADGYEKVPNTESLLTSQAQRTDPKHCVPKGTLSAQREAAESARAVQSVLPSSTPSAMPSTGK